MISLGSATERTSCGQLIVNFGRVGTNRLKQKCSLTDGKLQLSTWAHFIDHLHDIMYCTGTLDT